MVSKGSDHPKEPAQPGAGGYQDPRSTTTEKQKTIRVMVRCELMVADRQRISPARCQMGGVRVELYRKGQDEIVDDDWTDSEGRCEFRVPDNGPWTIKVAEDLEQTIDLAVRYRGVELEELPPLKLAAPLEEIAFTPELGWYRRVCEVVYRPQVGYLLGSVSLVDAQGRRDPLPQVKVRLRSTATNVDSETETNEQGWYWFDRVEPGSYQLEVRKSVGGAKLLTDLSTPIKIRPSERIGRDIEYALTRDVYGTVYYREPTRGGAAGQPAQLSPLENVQVELHSLDHIDHVLRTTTDENGEFSFDVPGNGDWLVRFQEKIGNPTPLSATSIPAGLPPLRLSNPAQADIEVCYGGQSVDVGPILYQAEDCRVQGRFLYRTLFGQEIPLVGVRIVLENLVTGETLERETDSHGIYQFVALQPGSYRLVAPAMIIGAKAGLEVGNLQLSQLSSSAFAVAPGMPKERDIIYSLLEGEVGGLVFIDEDGSGRRFGDEEGLAGVRVVLVDEELQEVREAWSDRDGAYRFSDVPPGNYTLRFASQLHVGDEEYHLTTAREQEVEVRTGELTEALPAGYGLEVHEIRGRVVEEDGSGLADVVVTLHDLQGQEIAATVTDKEGYYVFRDYRGEFEIRFPEQAFERELSTVHRRIVRVNSIATVPDTRYRLVIGRQTGMGQGSGGGALQDAVVDIASYMPTSTESGGHGTYSGDRGQESGGSLQRSVESTLTEVLGRRLRADDPKAFLGAVKSRFAIRRDKDNSNSWVEWLPRSYSVQTELGGEISGAQASIYRRAQVALEDALPRLDALEPLEESVDEEEVRAVRSIVRTQLEQVVKELGEEGGPRSHRMDQLFAILMPQLDRLQFSFGLSSRNVITVDEERNLTDYLIIRDYAEGLRASWESFRNRFAGMPGNGAGVERFLGTQFVLLQRAFSGTLDSVDEVYRAMEAVNIGPNERQLLYITFPPEGGRAQAPLTADELLRWVTEFVHEEAPHLILESGRLGVEAVRPTARRLAELVRVAAQGNNDNIGFTRPRVRRALTELAVQLEQVERLAGELVGDDRVDAASAARR